mmetsp:Transcript_19524/g.30012  ORF Transcript_19524/g.30012 Transcript_19524/m.30012 type:complete len:90 (+) Transcript_19524:1701-1970(+)
MKYRLKTFDDDSEQSSDSPNHRRAPKLIKFKSKRPSEKLSKGEDSKNAKLNIYTPEDEQKSQGSIQILKPYAGFSKPDFYQGPRWKFVR